MNGVEYARRQWAWRSWHRALEALPDLRGKTVLDLGCSIGDLAAALTTRGAEVIGLDLDRDCLEAARARALPGAVFEERDLRGPLGLTRKVDGVWGSFVAGYFVDLRAVLPAWTEALRPGGFVALTEVDDLFGHEPLDPRTRALFQGYAREALAAERYDFHMGGRLRDYLEQGGFTVTKEIALPDRELSFDGPASPEVLAGWRARFDKMRLLQDFCGAEYEKIRDDFLDCLARPDHRALARVVFVVATRRAVAGSVSGRT
jgi:SAM-dependent methyltransferase